MCKWILVAIVVAFVLLMAGAALVVQEYGWPGFLAFLVGLVVLAYVLRLGLPRLFMYLVTRPMRQMGAALRGARIVVHSVTPCDPPPAEEWEEDPSDDSDDEDYGGRRLTDRRDRDDEEDEDETDEEDDEDEDATGPLDWYQIELTVVPPDAGSCEGRMVTRPAWTPHLVGAVGPRPPGQPSNPFRGWPLGDQCPGGVQQAGVEVWSGSDYDDADEQVYGEQRLRLRIGVTRDVRTVTITYAHYTDIGEVRLPRIDVSPGRGS